MRKEYTEFLSTIAQKITAKELATMKFLCKDFIPYTKLTTYTTDSILSEVFDFFCKLEEHNKLDIDDLEWMEYMLGHIEREDILFEVTAFQLQRSLYLSSLTANEGESETNQTGSQEEETPEEPRQREEQQAIEGNRTSRGTILMQCAPYLAGGAWVVGSAYILNLYKRDPKALVNLVTKVVLPTGTFVKSIFAGSINFVLQATDLNSLKELWKRYQTGRLKEDLQKVMVTEELQNLASGQPIDLEVKMSENEYRNACLDLMIAQTKAKTQRKGIILSELPRRVSRSLTDLTSIDTPDDLSRGLLLAQLSSNLKKNATARKIEKNPTNSSLSVEKVACLVQQINTVQDKIKDIEVNIGKVCPDKPEVFHRLMYLEEQAEKYLYRIQKDAYFRKFVTLLEKLNCFLKNARFLLRPEEAVKRIGSFVSRLKQGPQQTPYWKSVFQKKEEEPRPFYRMIPQYGLESVMTLTVELKEMARLLVKLFELDPELLKAKPKLSDHDDDSDDEDNEDDPTMRFKVIHVSTLRKMHGKEFPFSEKVSDDDDDDYDKIRQFAKLPRESSEACSPSAEKFPKYGGEIKILPPVLKEAK